MLPSSQLNPPSNPAPVLSLCSPPLTLLPSFHPDHVPLSLSSSLSCPSSHPPAVLLPCSRPLSLLPSSHAATVLSPCSRPLSLCAHPPTLLTSFSLGSPPTLPSYDAPQLTRSRPLSAHVLSLCLVLSHHAPLLPPCSPPMTEPPSPCVLSRLPISHPAPHLHPAPVLSPWAVLSPSAVLSPCSRPLTLLPFSHPALVLPLLPTLTLLPSSLSAPLL